MTKRLMNFNYLAESEQNTLVTTQFKIPVWTTKYPTLLDTLFEVPYYIGVAKDSTTLEGHFYTLGYQNLIQFPYTIRGTCILLERGYYYEAIPLVRNLFESLFQLRYFHKHPDAISSHWKGRKIRIKMMFEEIAPGFYDEIYGKQLSEFTHGGLASSMFRISYATPDKGIITMGSEYDEAGCTYSVIKLIVITFGILNYVPVLFPQYDNLVTVATENKRKDSISWLESIIKAHLVEKPESKAFYDLVRPLVYV